MKAIDLSCPPKAWPRRFTGISAIGVTNVVSGESDSLWIVFIVEQGDVVQSLCAWGTGALMPDSVTELKPVIFARAERATWELLAGHDVAAFHVRVQEGQLHIGGDFRLFARNALSLLKAAETTGLWAQIDFVIASCGNDSSTPS